MILRDPWYLALLLLVPFSLWYLRVRRDRSAVLFPSTQWRGITPSSRGRLLPLLPVMRLGALVFAIIALARPQQGIQRIHLRQQGIDIALAVDVSTSMLAEDFNLDGRRRNRLDVVKEVVGEFIDRRSQDRLAVVVFARRPYLA